MKDDDPTEGSLTLTINSTTRLMKDSGGSIIFSTHATPSKYSRMPLDTMLNGILHFVESSVTANCEVFARKIAADNLNIIATLRFPSDAGENLANMVERSPSGMQVDIIFPDTMQLRKEG